MPAPELAIPSWRLPEIVLLLTWVADALSRMPMPTSLPSAAVPASVTPMRLSEMVVPVALGVDSPPL